MRNDRENSQITGRDDVAMGNLRITLHRTVRVPEKKKGKGNSLPASMGHFKIFSVMDFKEKVPAHWKIQEGAYFICVYKHEAMWISFSNYDQPLALMVGAGMINAVTGEVLSDVLSKTPQNYLVTGHQPWLDGFKTNVGGAVYQFVGANLGEGETVEEQITGKAEFGGLQFAAFKPKVKLVRPSRPNEFVKSLGSGYPHTFGGAMRGGATKSFSTQPKFQEMGLGAGGAIDQKIYPDLYTEDHPLEKIWETNPFMKTYIYMVDPATFEAITGMKAPSSPITYQTYQKMGLPWFGLFDEKLDDVPGSGKIEGIKKVGGAPDAVFATEEKEAKPKVEEPKIEIEAGDTGQKSLGLKKTGKTRSPTEEDKQKETLKLWS